LKKGKSPKSQLVLGVVVISWKVVFKPTLVIFVAFLSKATHLHSIYDTQEATKQLLMGCLMFITRLLVEFLNNA
jgi:hypothetical protein